jgi:para-nitrobenzyl esterase
MFIAIRRFPAGLLAAVFAMGLTATTPFAAESAAVVRLDSGRVQGATRGDVTSYKGIPFAPPPVGALRWRAPQPVAAWSGVRSATEFGSPCLQASPNGPGAALSPSPSEDCLYVNVWRPLRARGTLPVMVWIYGGGLLNGAASLPLYDGAQFARRGVILVSFNYRLGRFGIFAHPALSREAADGGRIANYGLMDQIAALEWVQRNIRAFGGDPHRVTIFGESAGAASVDILLATQAARGLFQGAIAESGYGRANFARLTTMSPDDKLPAEQDGVALMKAIGVETDDPAILRAVPAAEIQAKASYNMATFGFILDGKLLTQDLWAYYRQGTEAPVPLVIGSNSLETPAPPGANSPFAHQLDPYVHPDEKASLEAVYGSREALDLNLSSDVVFDGQGRSLALMHAAHGFPTFVYRFSAVPASLADRLRGAPHASELPYVFDNLDAVPTLKMQARDQALSDALIAYWVAFAKTGKPEPQHLPTWPPADGRHIMDFTNDGPKPGIDERTERYEALARLVDPRS